MMMPIYWTVVTAFKPERNLRLSPVYFPTNATFEPFDSVRVLPFVD